MTKSLNRTYVPKECITFRKTNESFGGLSNMASGYILWVNSTRILTSEALYQACRFPHLPEVQRSIIMQGSPMTAKMKSKPYRDQSRADWDQVRVKIMRWCLRVKLAQNWEKFSELLLRTGDKPIVEDSRKDRFWGAVMNEQGVLEGRNALGRLLMELREELKGSNSEVHRTVQPIDIPDFLLYGQPIGLVVAKTVKPDEGSEGRRLKPLGTRRPDEPVKTYAPPAAKADLFSEPKQPMEVHEPKPQEPLKPYPAYKPAAIPWLQQVPEHWDITPGLSHLRFKQEKNTGMVEKQVLSLSYGRIVIKPKEKLVGLVPESFETYQIVGPGDIIVRATDLQNDRTSLRIGEVKDRGIITSAYLCLNVHNGMVPSFGYYLIHAYDLMKVLYGFGSGLRQNLDWKDFKRMPLAVPPPEEQNLIVRYLHTLDTKVKRYIHSKRTLIARLQEQKQAIIQRAVTRGLDPNVNLKSSGVEWLGAVPEGWKSIRIKYLLREVDARSGTGKETLLSMRMHHGIVPFAEHFSHPPQGATMIGFKLVKPGQVVVNRMQAGNGLIFKSDLTGLVSPDYAVFDCSPVVNVDFLMELFRSRKMRTKFRQESKGLGTGTSGFLRLYNDRLGAIHIALPPIAVQTTILVTLEAELQGLHTAIQRVENEINLMLEYHTRLIADVVTGAVDVREAAKAMKEDQMIGRSEDQMRNEKPMSMAAEGEAGYGEDTEL